MDLLQCRSNYLNLAIEEKKLKERGYNQVTAL
jgi:hypothetical protein